MRSGRNCKVLAVWMKSECFKGQVPTSTLKFPHNAPTTDIPEMNTVPLAQSEIPTIWGESLATYAAVDFFKRGCRNCDQTAVWADDSRLNAFCDRRLKRTGRRVPDSHSFASVSDQNGTRPIERQGLDRFCGIHPRGNLPPLR